MNISQVIALSMLILFILNAFANGSHPDLNANKNDNNNTNSQSGLPRKIETAEKSRKKERIDEQIEIGEIKLNLKQDFDQIRPDLSNMSNTLVENQLKDILNNIDYDTSQNSTTTKTATTSKYFRNKRKIGDLKLYNLKKRLNEEKRREELMAADANPRMEPNYTNILPSEGYQMHGINTEQLYNKKTDKIRILHMQQANDQNQFYDSSKNYCDFESDCRWTWKKDIANGFFIASAAKFEANETGPKSDASIGKYGSFLLLRLKPGAVTEFHVTSPLFSPSSTTCKLRLYIYQEAMEGGEIKVVGDKYTNHSQSINNHTQWLVTTINGDNSKSWKKYEWSVGKISKNFSIILEVVPSPNLKPGALVAFDNIELSQCYPRADDSCGALQYRCNSTVNCINRTRICDINKDCPGGDDEDQNCDQMPYGAKCSFEDNWCGWYNVDSEPLRWQRHNGSTPTNYTGPNFDHTYMNTTGNYIYVNMLKDDAKFSSRATLNSVIFNPPPRVHGNISSRFYNSCAIRFYLHKTGKHKSGLSLQLTELKPPDNESKELLWSYNDHGDKWIRQVIILPNITHKYFIHFTARKGIRYMSDIAIDDISLSPECFGLNIPPQELNGYNYWNPQEYYAAARETHQDFVNETYYKINTCNVKGRYGPSQMNCNKAYNNTKVHVKVLNEPGLSGVQKWIVPHDNYYTFIISGAGGGKGSNAMGSSRGATIRTVLDLKKGQELYMLVGQEGQSACVKRLEHQRNSSCSINMKSTMSAIRDVLNIDIIDSGGGGGGASYVFTLNRTRGKIPLAVAAGGGGLGLFQFIDTEMQHGRGVNLSIPPFTGKMYGEKSAGAGGGWVIFPGIVDESHKEIMGSSFEAGSIGGKACYNSTDGRGDGGFGGGGGGCKHGGGGGGYAGGDANSLSSNSSNGEGGYSYYDTKRTMKNLTEVTTGYNVGSGSILIIPANSGCGCDFRCVALDERRSQVKCLCPKTWKLDSNGVTCIPLDASTTNLPTWLQISLIVAVFCLIIGFGAICFVLYNRYQQRATGILRRKILSGADLQLDRLRMASDSMMTEYNPNYEFGGVVYTLKDLKDIPREQLRLVKALGQGAFGEVYQGFYRQRPCDTVEMPVAVKTLPEMSTSQAEMDFLMEALIMSKFNHPNIVHFIGVCFDKHPRFIVLELLAGGDLKNFLRESRPKPERNSSLSMKDLVLIAVDVAKGCKYLEDNRFIHRDIAARNCLLTTKGPGRVVKIADFGMSRDVYRSDYYRKGGKAMLPIKWMPPEAFLDGIFTSKTDVWSFGVLLWEIMSMGYMPYTGCANREVMQLVTSGGRLDPPANCPGPIYGIMTQCWHPTPEQRPTFGTILERLGYCAQDPQVMNAPLPVFNRPPSTERDTTLMRPLSSDEHCLQIVPTTSDYLIPNHSTPTNNAIESTSSVEKLLPDNSDNWETSFIMPQSKSTQPLLSDNSKEDEAAASNIDRLLSIDNANQNAKISPISLPNHILSNHNNNTKDTNLKSGVSLDASALAKQLGPQSGTQKYANVNPGDNGVTNNGILHNSFYPNQNKYVNSVTLNNNPKLVNEGEINC